MVRVSCRAVQTSADQRRQLESSDVLQPRQALKALSSLSAIDPCLGSHSDLRALPDRLSNNLPNVGAALFVIKVRGVDPKGDLSFFIFYFFVFLPFLSFCSLLRPPSESSYSVRGRIIINLSFHKRASKNDRKNFPYSLKLKTVQYAYASVAHLTPRYKICSFCTR